MDSVALRWTPRLFVRTRMTNRQVRGLSLLRRSDLKFSSIIERCGRATAECSGVMKSILLISLILVSASTSAAMDDRRPLDLPSGGSRIDTEEEQPESILFYGNLYEASCFVFVVDHSLSMEGERWELALQELTDAVNSLSGETEFSAVLFGEEIDVWSRKPKPATIDKKKSMLSWFHDHTPVGSPAEVEIYIRAVTEGLTIAKRSLVFPKHKTVISISDSTILDLH